MFDMNINKPDTINSNSIYSMGNAPMGTVKSEDNKNIPSVNIADSFHPSENTDVPEVTAGFRNISSEKTFTEADFVFGSISKTGRKIWEFETGDPIISSPCKGPDGTLYISSKDHKLYAINPDGSRKWEFETWQQIISSPCAGPDGTVYVGSDDCRLYAVNPDGSMKWEYRTGNSVQSSPCVGKDGTVYVGSNDGSLHAINPDGTGKWEYPTGCRVQATPCIDRDGTIYISNNDGKMHAVTPEGRRKWKFETGDPSQLTSAVTSPNGTLYVGSANGKFYAISPENGKPKWSVDVKSPIIGAPCVGEDGTVYVDSDKSLLAFDKDGNQKWEYKTDDYTMSQAVINPADGTIYVGSYDHKLHAISPKGYKIGEFKTGSMIGSHPLVDPDGTVYIGSMDNKLYAVEIKSLKKLAEESGQGEKVPQNTAILEKEEYVIIGGIKVKKKS